MRRKTGLVLLAVGLFATVANAGVFYDPTNVSGSMTANGWSIEATGDADLLSGKARDVSHSDPAEGTNGVWHVEDINSPSATYMWGYKNDPGAIDQTRGIITARINLFDSASNSGTFGYSSAEGNHGVVMSLRNGGIGLKGANGTGSGDPIPVANMQNQYRVYAMAYTYVPGGAYSLRLWISNGNDWSNNASDWTELNLSASNLTGYSSSLLHFKDPSQKLTGVCLGSYGSSGSLQNYAIDWLYAGYNDLDSDEVLTPWGDTTPEPAALLLMVLGAPLLRRRR
jgi:MYXO-CTERM domain-containing protein